MAASDRTFVPEAFSPGMSRQIPGMMGASHHATQEVEPFSVTYRLLLVADKFLLDGFPFFPTDDGIYYLEIRQRAPVLPGDGWDEDLP